MLQVTPAANTALVVDYLSLPPPVRYEELQREVMSTYLCLANPMPVCKMSTTTFCMSWRAECLWGGPVRGGGGSLTLKVTSLCWLGNRARVVYEHRRAWQGLTKFPKQGNC